MSVTGVRPPEAGPALTRAQRLAFLGILSLASVLRLWRLGHDGLWRDEAATAEIAHWPIWEVLLAVRADVQAPLYFVIQHVVVGAIGEGEAQLRGLSAIAGIATVALVFVAGRSAVGTATGLLAAFALCVAPLHVHYSREARGYALMGLLLVVAFLALRRLDERQSVGRIVAAAAALAGTFLSHGTAPILGAGIFLAAASWPSRGTSVRPLVAQAAAGALAAVAWLPWMIWSYGQVTTFRDRFQWAQEDFGRWFPWQPAVSVITLAPGAQEPIRNGVGAFGPLDILALLLMMVAVALAVARGNRTLRTAIARWATALVLPSVLLVLACVVMGPAYVLGRTESPLAPFAALLVGAGAAAIPGRLAVVLAALVGLVASTGLVHATTRDMRSHERLMTGWVAERLDDRDAVVVVHRFRDPVSYYLRRAGRSPHLVSWRAPRGRSVGPPAEGPSDVAQDAAEAAAAVVSEVRRRGGRRVWLVVSTRPAYGLLIAEVARHGEIGETRLDEKLDLWLVEVRVAPG